MIVNDWFESFVAAVLAAFQGLNPYVQVPSFLSPPWTIPILAPFVWLPWWIIVFLPLIALTGLAFYRKKPYLIVIVGTSFSFIALSVYGNIDWLVMIGLVVGGPFGGGWDSLFKSLLVYPFTDATSISGCGSELKIRGGA